MGYWKDVAYDISRGMSKRIAEEINAVLRSKTATRKEKQEASVKGEIDIKLNTMP